MSDACRQRYKLATGQGLDSPPKGPHPGFKSGGPVKKQAGGQAYGKGGKSKRGR
jgi:hypothetical protein